MSIISVQVVIPFEVTTGLRKKVANALNIAFSDLPPDDHQFISDVLVPYMEMTFYIVDTIDGNNVMLTDYISSEVPEEYIPKNIEEHTEIEIDLPTIESPMILEVVSEN